MVDGFVAGLHRSPDFGFSQEFAEYRAYTPGDDLRHVDWNVFARTERMYLKRYRGETNCQLTMLLDMQPLHEVTARTRSTSWSTRAFSPRRSAYLAQLQRDAAGLIVFDDEVRNFVPPSTRQGQLARLLHAIESAEVGTRTDFAKPFSPRARIPAPPRPRRRDFGFLGTARESHQDHRAAALPRQRSWFCSTCSIPRRSAPSSAHPVLLEDLETGDDARSLARLRRPTNIRPRSTRTSKTLRSQAKGAGLDYFLIDTSRPLDAALREYLAIRRGRHVNGFLHSLVSAGVGGSRLAHLAAPAEAPQNRSAACSPR